MDWSPNSPDLNPTENVWSLLKDCIRKMMRDPNKRLRHGQELIEVVQEEWEKPNWKQVDGIIEKMQERIEECH
jgi:hypothetical protein